MAFTSLTGLGDYNEMVYLSNCDSSGSAARYDYSFGDFGVHVSADNPYDVINDTSRDTGASPVPTPVICSRPASASNSRAATAR